MNQLYFLKIIHFKRFRYGKNSNIQAYVDKNEWEAPNGDGAALVGDTLYVRPGAIIDLRTRWDVNRDDATVNLANYETDPLSNFSISPNTSGFQELRVPHKVNAKTTIAWRNNFGSTLSLKVQTAYIGNETIIFYSGSNMKDCLTYKADKTKEAYKNKETTIDFKISTNQYSASVENTNGVEVKDIDGVTSDGKINIDTTNGWYRMKFVPVNNGLLQVSWSDYNGNRYVRYIEVKLVEPKVELPVNEDPPQEEQAPSQSPSNPSNPSSPSTPPAQTPPSAEKHTYQAPKPAPSISLASEIRNGNKVTVKLNLTNCTEAIWYMFKPGTYSLDHCPGGLPVKNNTFTYDVTEYEDGQYHMVVYAFNGDKMSAIAYGPITLGPSAGLQVPTVNYTQKTNDDGGTATVNFNISNCTEAYYYIQRRDVNSDGTLKNYVAPSSSYAQFKAGSSNTGAKFNPTKLSKLDNYNVHIPAVQYGSGYYDVVLWTKNTTDEFTNCTVVGPIYINNAPQVSIIAQTQKNTFNSRTYQLMAYEMNSNDSCTAYYKIDKYADDSEYKGIDFSSIKETGTQFSGQTMVTLNETGIYNIGVYAEDKWGKVTEQTNKHIMVSEAPQITYTIQGEEEGKEYTTVGRDVQKIDVKVTDVDDNENIALYYFISDKDWLADGKKISEGVFWINNAKQLMTDVTSGETGTIEVTGEEGTKTTKYVYLMAMDKFRAISIIRTGSIEIDNVDLKLEAIYTNKEQQEGLVGYKTGDDFQVIFQFNHMMKELDVYPDLTLMVESNQGKVSVTLPLYSSNVTVEDNKVIYHFNISDSTINGDITNLKINYEDAVFMDANQNANIYSEDFNKDSNVINEVSKKCYIDTKKAQVESMTMNIKSDDNSNIVVDKENDITYVKGINSADLVVKYSENVIKEGAKLQAIKAKKAGFFVNPNKNTEEERTEDTYSFTEYINLYSSYEGEIQMYGFVPGYNVTDLAGNDVNYKNLPDLKYTINSKDIETSKVVFDDSIDKIKVTTNGNISSYVEEVLNTGSKVKYYEEYQNQQQLNETTKIGELTFNVYYNDNDVIVKDKEENVIQATSIGESDGGIENYAKLAEYTLTEEQLPICVSFDESGKYATSAYKKDILGNEDTCTKEFTITELAEINNDKTGFSLLNSSEYYNKYDLTEDEKEFVITLKLDNSVSAEDILVNASITRHCEKILYTAEHIGSIVIDGITYEQYSFKPDYGGKFEISVQNSKTAETLLNTIVENYNVYIPCDTNFDGFINAMDTVNVLRYLALLNKDEWMEYICDVDGDGEVSIGDPISLSRYIAEDPLLGMNNRGYIYGKK